MSTKLTGLLAVVLVVALGLGIVNPPRASANDTGKLLLAIGAGLLVGSLLANHHHDRYYHPYYYTYPQTQSYYYSPYAGRDSYRYYGRNRDDYGYYGGDRSRVGDRWQNWDSGWRGDRR